MEKNKDDLDRLYQNIQHNSTNIPNLVLFFKTWMLEVIPTIPISCLNIGHKHDMRERNTRKEGAKLFADNIII